jgi:hypothetical protein
MELQFGQIPGYKIIISHLNFKSHVHFLSCSKVLVALGCKKFPKIWKPSQNSMYQKDDTRQYPYSGPTITGGHSKKYGG